jgi:hypothetical protein
MPVQADIMRSILARASQEGPRKTIAGLFNILVAEQMAEVPLEDIFTILDRARNARETLRGFTHAALESSYQTLISAIIAEFERRLAAFDAEPYEAFAAELLRHLDRGARSGDPQAWSIVTLNWDTILDSVLARAGGPDVHVDYGCDDHPLEGTPPARRDSAPAYLLKLHGSLNWLVCTACGRLFSSAGEGGRAPVLMPLTRSCPDCEGTLLESVIITPTLVKDLRLTQLQSVWHRALLTLQRARRIVFVGYSLPLADFELRYLLLRSIIGHPRTSIRVVLYPPDALLRDERQRLQRDEIEHRYRTFFGARDLELAFLDAAAFMRDPVAIWDW